MIDDAEHVGELQKEMEVLKIVQDLWTLAGNEWLLEKVAGTTIVDVNIQLASSLSTCGAN
jgi:hypothetical protein